MKETHVVTCFLMSREGKLLILRRGNLVGTYQGRWAGVAGFLEVEPREQAYTEISEEVALDRTEATLLVEGKPLKVPDPEVGRIWVIHPFLFQVASPEKIRLDWEHTELRWIDPKDLGSYLTVPGLQEALDRVYGL